MSRPTPKQIAWELDGPKASHPAERLLDALREHGYVIVHPDDQRARDEAMVIATAHYHGLGTPNKTRIDAIIAAATDGEPT